MVGGQVEAYAEREGVEVEFSGREERDDGAGEDAADGEVANDAIVAGLLFEGEALLGGDGWGGCWGGHFLRLVV